MSREREKEKERPRRMLEYVGWPARRGQANLDGMTGEKCEPALRAGDGDECRSSYSSC